MQLLPNGKVLITSGLMIGQHNNPHFAGRKGKIFLIEMYLPGKRPEEVEIRGKPDAEGLEPHGISAWVDPESGVVTVFVVNHQYLPDTYSVVEKFTYDSALNILHHVETIGKEDPAFRLLNDVAAVSAEQFYFTNFFHYSNFFVEALLQLRWGIVGFYDGHQGRIVVGGLLAPNGINVSPDLKYVYMSNSFDKSLGIYERGSDNNLTLHEEYRLYSSPDNINIDPSTGDLIVGVGPVPWKTISYADNPEIPNPSQVLRLKVKEGHVTDVTQIVADNGNSISASSAAVHFKGHYLIGSIFSKAYICDART